MGYYIRGSCILMRWPYDLNLGNGLDDIGSSSVYSRDTLTHMSYCCDCGYLYSSVGNWVCASGFQGWRFDSMNVRKSSKLGKHDFGSLHNLTTMRTSCFNTEFTSQIKLTKFPLILCFVVKLLDFDSYALWHCMLMFPVCCPLLAKPDHLQ